MAKIKLVLLGFGMALLSACAGTATVPQVSEPIPHPEDSQSKDFSRSKDLKNEDVEKNSPSEKITVSDSVKNLRPDSLACESLPHDSAQTKKEEPFDVYVEISQIARKALSRADSFDALGMKDSVFAIAEQFFVLNPLWEEWLKSAKALVEKERQTSAASGESLKRLLIDLANANARRVDFSEIRTIADSIRTFALDDSSLFLVDSVLQQAYSRTFEKVKKNRDAALAVAVENAGFDDAERVLADLLLRYPDFADTLRLRESLVKISSMRVESAAFSESYWKNHDPRLLLEEARKLSAESQWDKAKDIFQKLKSSNLRGEAVRELDSLGARFCTEKRERAASLFAKSRNKKSDRSQMLKDAVGELDACLVFAPNYRERATVLSNKEFLSRELAK